MNKKKIKKMAQSESFIEGIYNYCDRWCEKCPYTSKCMVYATEQQDSSDPETRDINNEKFWNQISNSFQLAMEMLHDFAEEEGIDLENIDSQAIEAAKQKVREKAEDHPAAQQAKKYGRKVNQWFEEASGDFEDIEEAMLTKLKLGLPEDDIKQEAERLGKLTEIIRWYQHQIYVKIMRALQARYDSFDESDSIQNDANGSAKVALMGIERSMSAWVKLLNHFPNFEEAVFSLLVLLEQTKRSLLDTFPKAKRFIRPGFDD